MLVLLIRNLRLLNSRGQYRCLLSSTFAVNDVNICNHAPTEGPCDVRFAVETWKDHLDEDAIGCKFQLGRGERLTFTSAGK